MVSAQDEYNDETVEVRTNPLPETLFAIEEI